jgi:type IV secretion system protein TrbJ
MKTPLSAAIAGARKMSGRPTVLVAVLSAKGRADALEQARTAASESQGQQQYKIFSTRSGYQPGNVTMFSGN